MNVNSDMTVWGRREIDRESVCFPARGGVHTGFDPYMSFVSSWVYLGSKLWILHSCQVFSEVGAVTGHNTLHWHVHMLSAHVWHPNAHRSGLASSLSLFGCKASKPGPTWALAVVFDAAMPTNRVWDSQTDPELRGDLFIYVQLLNGAD